VTAFSRLVLAAALLACRVAAGAGQGADAANLPRPSQLEAAEASSRFGVVVSGSELASRIGAAVLEDGGNAVDAAVATALALGVAEPGQSGLGGQTYVLICWPGGRCVAVDGSCRVPLRTSRPALKQLAESGRQYGHEWVATPGTLAALAYTLATYGRKPLAEVIAPVIELADAGATWTPNQLHFLTAYLGKVREHPYLADLVLQDRLSARLLDHRYCNDDLARTLRRIAAGGAREFYAGSIAGEIERDMVAHGGFLQRDDLATLTAVERTPLRGVYRGLDIVSFPKPGGGASVIMALEILDRFSSARLAQAGADSLHLQIEAARLGIATSLSAGASAWHPPEWMRTAASECAGRIRSDRALFVEELGGDRTAYWRDRDTTHLSVADRDGMVVSLTQTLGHGFGACVATPGLGFPYNSALLGFDLDQPRSDFFLAPRRSSATGMAPTILLRDGRPFLVLGGVGSARITASIVLTLVNRLDRGMPLSDAVGAPRALWGSAPENTLTVELGGSLTEDVAAELQRLGHAPAKVCRFPVSQADLGWQGGVNAIEIAADGTCVGVGDPRRQGTPVAAAR
jgi:gamma-glutamyltranspeptidase/glutathione hydrolase